MGVVEFERNIYETRSLGGWIKTGLIDDTTHYLWIRYLLYFKGIDQENILILIG